MTDSKKISIREFVEPGADQIGAHNATLDDASYELAMRGFPILCSDVLAVNRADRTFYLAQRNVHPKKTWWCFGGRCQRGELSGAAAIRKLKQETGLEVLPERLALIAIQRYVMALREQVPQEAGSDCLSYVYVLEPTAEELATITANLETKEYLAEGGLREFNREQMLMARVEPEILALYEDVFG